jgi:hypothetical protein
MRFDAGHLDAELEFDAEGKPAELRKGSHSASGWLRQMSSQNWQERYSAT